MGVTDGAHPPRPVETSVLAVPARFRTDGNGGSTPDYRRRPRSAGPLFALVAVNYAAVLLGQSSTRRAGSSPIQVPSSSSRSFRATAWLWPPPSESVVGPVSPSAWARPAWRGSRRSSRSSRISCTWGHGDGGADRRIVSVPGGVHHRRERTPRWLLLTIVRNHYLAALVDESAARAEWQAGWPTQPWRRLRFGTVGAMAIGTVLLRAWLVSGQAALAAVGNLTFVIGVLAGTVPVECTSRVTPAGTRARVSGHAAPLRLGGDQARRADRGRARDPICEFVQESTSSATLTRSRTSRER